MRILAIGDFHIPTRAREVPFEVKEFAERAAADIVLCTGDLVAPDVLDWLKTLSKSVYVVQGNMDYLDLPESHVIELQSGVKIGLVHGHQVFPRGHKKKLAKLALKMGVNILVSGHTHVADVSEVEIEGNKVLLVNPGSATGVWSGGGGSLVPSLALIEVYEDKRELNVLIFEKRVRELEVVKSKVWTW